MNIQDFRKTLTGISGVPITAYDKDGEVDAVTTRTIYARVAEAGIHNIVAAGNTGEFYAYPCRNCKGYRSGNCRR